MALANLLMPCCGYHIHAANLCQLVISRNLERSENTDADCPKNGQEWDSSTRVHSYR
jgi:hypothetical protein